MDELTFRARGISVTVDLAVGHLAGLTVEAGGRLLQPLHRAPWIDEPDLPEGIADGLRRLSGDFLCAPFSTSDACSESSKRFATAGSSSPNKVVFRWNSDSTTNKAIRITA